MRTFSQKQTQPQKLVSSSLTRSNGPAHETAHSQHYPARFDFARIRIQPAGRSLPFLDTIQRSFGRHNISDIQAHTDSRAAAEAQSMGALAFARGREVKFAHPASLRTAAHEAAHVVQQRAGVAIDRADAYERHADQVADRVSRGQSSEALLDVPPGAGASHPQSGAASAPVIQMRRIPPNVRALLTAAGGADGANFTSNAEGAQRLIDRAMADLDPAQRVWVLMQRRGALTEAQFLALPQREQLSRHAEAIVGLFPSRKMGDPKLIDTGPRPAAPDAANLMKLVTRTNKVFDDIASGARDEWLTQVFGARSIRAAKAKYAKARKAMNDLHKKGSIVTDRSGYSEEVALAGLTDPPGTVDQKIRLEKSDIDKPDDNDSVATLLHESMHAGNADIGDMYTGIQTETEAKKLTFATCYEVIVWRILEPANQQGFPANPPTVPPTFQTFVPPGTKVGSKKAPDLTKAEIGAKAAIDLFRSAWNTGLNLQGLYFDLFRKPTELDGAAAGIGRRPVRQGASVLVEGGKTHYPYQGRYRSGLSRRGQTSGVANRSGIVGRAGAETGGRHGCAGPAREGGRDYRV